VPEATGGTAAEDLEGGQRRILLVGGTARGVAELGTGEADQVPEVSLPELAGRLVGVPAALQLTDPARDRFLVPGPLVSPPSNVAYGS